MIKFSVVIAVYNKEDYIVATLRSVLSQTVQNIEVIVVDDGSTDESARLVKSIQDPRIRFFSQKNQGAGAARNAAIQKAQANFIALLDADDLWHPDHLETIDTMIAASPQEKVFATNSVFIQSGKQLSKHYSITWSKEEAIQLNFFEASMRESIINSSTTVLHKDVFAQIGYYDESIKSGQDTDLFIRIGLQYPIVFHPNICVQIVRNDESLSRTAQRLEDKPSFEKFESLETDNPLLKKYIDQNRYSLCLLAKRNNDTRAFLHFYKKLKVSNLNYKQRCILQLPSFMIRFLYRWKKKGEKVGIRPVLR
ncbi:MAG: glycosyltransferase [Flavobacteriaceae bacterium]|nr:glycosyltransferase [Flavobacteriaceae bacterium]